MAEGEQRQRDAEREARERRRYALLEQVYLLSGPSARTIQASQIRRQLGPAADAGEPVWSDLERLGFVERARAGATVRITPAAVEYLQRRAWRRRSVREA